MDSIDFKTMSDEQIIAYCKTHNIKYLNKQDKPYTRKTLIKHIIDDVKIDVKEKKADVKEKKVDVKEKKVDVKENKKNINYFLNLKADYNKVLNEERDFIIKTIMDKYKSLSAIKYETKSLLELCTIKYGDKISTKDAIYADDSKLNLDLHYPVYDSGSKPIFYSTKFNRILPSKIATRNVTYDNCVMLLSSAYFLTDEAFTINSKYDKLSDEYLMIYLYTIKDEIMDCVTNSNLNVDKFLSLKVKFPVNVKVQTKCYREYLRIHNMYISVEKINNEVIKELKNYEINK